jgi:hypothetical protein
MKSCCLITQAAGRTSSMVEDFVIPMVVSRYGADIIDVGTKTTQV